MKKKNVQIVEAFITEELECHGWCCYGCNKPENIRTNCSEERIWLTATVTLLELWKLSMQILSSYFTNEVRSAAKGECKSRKSNQIHGKQWIVKIIIQQQQIQNNTQQY